MKYSAIYPSETLNQTKHEFLPNKFCIEIFLWLILPKNIDNKIPVDIRYLVLNKTLAEFLKEYSY